MARARPAVFVLGVVVVTACAGERPPVPVGARAIAVADAAVTTPAPDRVGATTIPAAPDPGSSSSAPGSSTSAPSTSTTSTTPPEPRVITMAFTGDILPHSPLWRQAGRNAVAAGGEGLDFGPMLDGMAPLLASVDLAVCHLETPIAPAGEEFSTAPFYGVPPEVVAAIASAGYERCSTASNHTADRGTAGVERTLDVLDAHGLGHSGMARTPAEIEPTVFDVDGVAVTHLSYTFSYNGLQFPEGEQWRSAMIDRERIVTDAETARRLGAEVVVVSLHWGEEKVHDPTTYQRNVAAAITASGAIDLVVGHHAHVLQPIERVNGTWVVFGLGNVLSNMPTSDNWPAASQDAAVVTVEFEVTAAGDVAVGRPVAHPTWVDKDDGWQVLLVLDELAGDDLSAGERDRLERSLARTRSVMGDFVPSG